MAARIAFITARAPLLRRDHALRLRQAITDEYGERPHVLRELMAVVDRHTASSLAWSFVMLGPLQNRAVVRWLLEHSKRPRMATLLWAELICAFRTDTGEIIPNRTQLAETVGATPRHVSEVLSELLRMGALIRRQEGRDVRWFMNPLVATALPGAERERAQRAAPPVLSVVESPPAE